MQERPSVTTKDRISEGSRTSPQGTEALRGRGDFVHALQSHARVFEDGQWAATREWAQACAQYSEQAVDAQRRLAREVGEHQRKLAEVLASASTGNEALARSQDAYRQLQEAGAALSAELEREKSAADQDLLAALRETQGQPDGQQSAQDAYRQYLERLQSMGSSPQAVKVQELRANWQQLALEAADYGQHLKVDAWRNYQDSLREALARCTA
jgi:chromosome segregation ATPase